MAKQKVKVLMPEFVPGAKKRGDEIEVDYSDEKLASLRKQGVIAKEQKGK